MFTRTRVELQKIFLLKIYMIHCKEQLSTSYKLLFKQFVFLKVVIWVYIDVFRLLFPLDINLIFH